jgi:uncharacterized membrane protein
MTTTQRLILPIRIGLVLAFAFALVMQVLSMPGEFTEQITRAPEAAHLVWPVFAVVELELLGFQVLIVCTWMLLTMIGRGRIFSEESFRWVNLLVRTLFVGWLLFAALSAYLVAVIFFTPELRDPGTPLLLFGILLIGAVFVMLVVVMRRLLLEATSLRSDLDEVI